MPHTYISQFKIINHFNVILKGFWKFMQRWFVSVYLGLWFLGGNDLTPRLILQLCMTVFFPTGAAMWSPGLNWTSCTCFLRPRSGRRTILTVCPPGSATLYRKAAKTSSTPMTRTIHIQLFLIGHRELQMSGFPDLLSEPRQE